MSNYDRVSVVVGLISLGLALFLIIELPSGSFSFTVLSLPITISMLKEWLMAVLLGGLAWMGANYVIQAHPAVRESGRLHTSVFCILPTMWVLLAVFLLPLAPHWLYWVGGLSLMDILLSLMLIAEYHAVYPEDAYYSQSRWGLNIAAHLMAVAFFVFVYRSKMRSMFSATATFAIGSLLALRILDDASQDLRRGGIYALIVGLVIGEATWALNYCDLKGSTGGLLLFLLFYLIIGLSKQHLREHFNRRVLLEFALVALLGIGLLIRHGVWG